MNRRSVLRWLGLAPVAAPAAVAAASAPALPPVDYSGLAADVRGRLTSAGFSFDGRVLSVPSLKIVAAPVDATRWMEARPAILPDGREFMITADGRAWEACRPA
ncbi:hypothetical protein E4V01_24070 [Methylorubrum sp. Q1]|uniref:hypothetical protein n=1 Tax=Methylorubrum sp. Q1 TaxID=2562453 RepID=UPI001075EC85|nr:hypothetical protein [Methylorubrum sp. Q1]TFZ54992.1 hypothetical protein E4V01_24070 [Methylorubrum sp. Q1]